MKWSIGLGIPMILFWVIGAPLFGFILLYKNNEKLEKEAFASNYRILYMGLKPECYYW
jgi:hypothetical protein